MNEEIGRILQMLESGKISAEEAERLIRASGEAGVPPSASPPLTDATAEEEARIHTGRAIEDFWDPFSPFANPLPDIGDLSRTVRRIKGRIRRHNTRRFWLSYFRLNRWYESRRKQRRDTMSAYERVRFVLLGAPPSGEFILQAQTDIHELLVNDDIAWSLFNLGLDEEFGFETTMDQLRAFRTVQDVVNYVEQQQQPTTESESRTDVDPDSEEPWDRPRPDELAEPQVNPAPPSRKRGAQSPKPNAGDSGLPPVE
jgi:hypothetical protein